MRVFEPATIIMNLRQSLWTWWCGNYYEPVTIRLYDNLPRRRRTTLWGWIRILGRWRQSRGWISSEECSASRWPTFRLGSLWYSKSIRKSARLRVGILFVWVYAGNIPFVRRHAVALFNKKRTSSIKKMTRKYHIWFNFILALYIPSYSLEYLINSYARLY
jgi:hypothetical protein